METKTTEHNELIANRQAPGDSWVLVGDKVVHKSLTEALEAWFQKTQQKAEFRLAPLNSKLYVIRQQEEEILPEEPQSFSIYGEFKQGV
jgi:hypothetical protein|tara:strand:- start:1371 stop:1637 length:267 start_codon:yes stop_codon:yes gene_type:complete